MLKLEQVKLRPEQPESELFGKAAQLLRIPPEELLSLSVLRRAVDARAPLQLVYALAVSVKNEKAALRRCRSKNVSLYAPESYTPPAAVTPPQTPPVVIGAGPAGLFAAFLLATPVCAPFCWSGGSPWSSGSGTWSASGRAASCCRSPMCSSVRAAPALSPTES